jgi:lipoprotein-anchoring transpeptidase ErfK/SrfK
MKRFMHILVLSSLLIGLLAEACPVAAQSQTPAQSEPYAGLPLCQPGAYISDPKDCVPLGPSTYITDLAEKGIQYPFPPILATKPDSSLTDVTLKFAKVNVAPPEQAPLYSSYEDATTGNNPSQFLKAGKLIYVSYSQRSDIDGNSFVYLKSNAWMRASPISDYSRYQGLVFQQPPAANIGWITDSGKPRSAPGYQSSELSTPLAGQTVVQIYDIKEQDGTKWYMVGINQWIERRYIRQLELNTTAPKGVSGNRWIDVNLYEQILSVYDNGKLVFATLMASGMKPFYTRPGLFQIYKKKPTETMSGAFEADQSDYYYLEDVPWTMYFDKERAIHGAYWRAMFGYEQSHGCINLSIGDSRWVYDWAKEGDWVYVHDPSGLTPTDPSLYTNGGA